MPRGAWVLLATLALGCGTKPQPRPVAAPPENADEYDTPAVFKDDVASQPLPDAFPTKFVDRDGKPVDLAQYRDTKFVVLVVLRGFAQRVCPNCSAQTSRLISNHDEFVKRDAAVLVVYPGPTNGLDAFMQTSRRDANNDPVPFPLLLDKNCAAVDQLHIRADLAKPATYILDKQGNLRFAYVGASTADRPSVKAMLAQLDMLRAEKP